MTKSGSIFHPFAPVFNEKSRIIILGTIPSPKSRENGFYYGHPQNAFWRVIAAVLGKDVPISVSEKTALLLQSGIALWDVLASCDISGANDASIKSPAPNNFEKILAVSEIRVVFANGKTAARLYSELCSEKTGIPAICLPSTSSANRRYYDFEGLVREYGVIKEYL